MVCVGMSAALQINPIEVGSHASIYLHALGFTDQPDWLLSPQADKWAVFILIVVAILSFAAFVSTFFRSTSNAVDRASNVDKVSLRAPSRNIRPPVGLDGVSRAQRSMDLGEQSLALCNEIREFARVYIVPTKAFEQEFISIHQADGNPARFAEMLAAHSRQVAERSANNAALFVERFSDPLRELLDGYLRYGVMEADSVDYYKWAIRTGFRHDEIADALAYIGKRLSNGQSFDEGAFDHTKFGP